MNVFHYRNAIDSLLAAHAAGVISNDNLRVGGDMLADLYAAQPEAAKVDHTDAQPRLVPTEEEVLEANWLARIKSNGMAAQITGEDRTNCPFKPGARQDAWLAGFDEGVALDLLAASPAPLVDQRAKALQAFEARVHFVASLAKNLRIPTSNFGTLLVEGHHKAEEFFDALAEYDAACKANQAAQDADRADAEADANQGHQALRDDE